MSRRGEITTLGSRRARYGSSDPYATLGVPSPMAASRPSRPFRQAAPFLQSSRSWRQRQMAGMGGFRLFLPA
jgi:hypothetical protein